MAISRFSNSRLTQGLPRYTRFWDQTTVPASPYFGYSMGGQTTGGTTLSSTLKFNFGTQTGTAVSTGLTYESAASSAGTTYKGNFGYKLGGNGSLDAQQYATKIAFSNDTKTNLSNLPARRGYAPGISNPLTAGYAWGGEGGSPLVYFGSALKIAYSNDSYSTLSDSPNCTNQPGGANNGTTAGYRFGGDARNLRKITFSNDSFSTVAASPAVDWEYNTCCTNGTTATYRMGGQAASLTNSIQKLTFSGESLSNLGATLSAARMLISAMSDFSTTGWMVGGSEAGGAVTTVQKITYSSETVSTLGTSLSTALYNAAVANNYAQEN